MISVKTKFLGTTPQSFSAQLQIQFITAKDALIALGEQTVEQMRNSITVSRDGSTGRLKKAITSEFTDLGPVGCSVGVGKIADLNANAPYWRVQNFGGFIPAGGKTIFGSFNGNPPDPALRGTGKGTEHFELGGGQVYAMTPRYPIAPKNYIEKTINWFKTVGRVHLSGRINRTTVFGK
jgi:hypothetical protein